jgi:hypothetical protein
VDDGGRHFLVYPFLFNLLTPAAAVTLNWENVAYDWVAARWAEKHCLLWSVGVVCFGVVCIESRHLYLKANIAAVSLSGGSKVGWVTAAIQTHRAALNGRATAYIQ